MTCNATILHKLALLGSEQAHMKKVLEEIQRDLTRLLYSPRAKTTYSRRATAIGRHPGNVFKRDGGTLKEHLGE